MSSSLIVSVDDEFADCVELFVLIEEKQYFVDDIARKFGDGGSDSVSKTTQLFDIFMRRSRQYGEHYPFIVKLDNISVSAKKCLAYRFLLVASKLSCFKKKFQAESRDLFQDYVALWFESKKLRSAVFSTPRAKRGLPADLKSAMDYVCKQFNEVEGRNDERITGDDNDFGVDVISSVDLNGRSIISSPFILTQCSTSEDYSAIGVLNKGLERAMTFPKKFKWAFADGLCVKSLALPYEISETTPLARISEFSDNGVWLLDRYNMKGLKINKSHQSISHVINNFKANIDKKLLENRARDLFGSVKIGP